MSNPIPLERGLGSSAAATVAGLVAAGALAGRSLDDADRPPARDADRGASRTTSRRRCSAGWSRASRSTIGVEAVRLEPPRDLLVVAWIPERKLPTSEMRRVLPDCRAARRRHRESRSRGRRAWRASPPAARTSFGSSPRIGSTSPTAPPVYPELPELVAAARAAGALGACLSGAGSTIVAFVDASDESAADRVGAAFRATAARLVQPGRLLALKPSSHRRPRVVTLTEGR